MSRRAVDAALTALLCGTAIAFTGCATILAGADQAITIDSYPPGARVTVGSYTATTPATLRLPKGRDYTVRISQGPDTRVVPLHRRFDPVTILNIIPPLWPGLIVDLATGAATKYEPDDVSIDFRTTSGSPPRARLVGARD